MSIKLMASAWEADLPSTEKMVLLCLCDFAGDSGVCWPSVKTIAAKCSMSERTVQGAIKRLRELGFCSWNDAPGKPHQFHLNPRKICTPAESAVPQKTSEPPQNLRPTPAESAPKPSMNHQEPPISKPRARKLPIPEAWEPEPFGIGTDSREIEDGWPPGERKTQLEQFKAHHRGKGNTFVDPQAAWSSWVINSRKFGNVRQRPHSDKPTTREIGERVAASFAGGSNGDPHLLPGPRAAGGNDRW